MGFQTAFPCDLHVFGHFCFLPQFDYPHLSMTLLELERSELRLGAYFMGISR